MSAYEDSYKSMLQGVSQQIARERLDGQVTAQQNMLSDAVTNLRRRPGAQYAFSMGIGNVTADSILAWDTDLAGVQCHVLLNTVDGVVRLLDRSYTLLAKLPESAYLATPDPTTIQVATVGDEFFLVNTAKRPSLGAPATGTNPSKRGFFYIKAGAFGRKYDITVTTAAGTALYEYLTPDGIAVGDAALANPQSIAQKLADLINAGTGTHGATATVDSSYVYVESNNASLKLSTASGSSYVITSNAGYLRQEADLPSRLPVQAAGYIIATGELRAQRYYKYDTASNAWLETGDFASPLSITNMPISIAKVGATWTLQAIPFEGRFAGDADSNPDPEFIKRGITGMSNYQGRLVLLSGSLVYMSASNKPRRFYRSTVTSLLDSDCIGVGASAASSASYRYAEPFGKDLILFSEKYQAVVPGNGVAITPRTATVVVTSTYESDMTSKPIACGRTLMYSAPRSKDFFGLLEMLPSSTLESQYNSHDSTAHLPKYMAGRCRFSVSSSVANMVLFAPTGDRKSLVVHEYVWQGDEKVQQAWHKWTFPYPVAAAYFSGQTIHVLYVNNGYLVGCTIDPRSGTSTSAAERLAKFDMGSFVEVVDHVVQLPEWLRVFDPTARARLKLAVAGGALAGEAVGSKVVGDKLVTDLSFGNGRVFLGFPFTSLVAPTPPMMKDSNGVKISTNKLNVLRFMVGTFNSSEYTVSIADTTIDASGTQDVGTLTYSSRELALGSPLVGEDSVAIVPARTNSNGTVLVISTDGAGELNIVSLEFAARYHEKINRMRR